jgi:hypothetical protein
LGIQGFPAGNTVNTYATGLPAAGAANILAVKGLDDGFGESRLPARQKTPRTRRANKQI